MGDGGSLTQILNRAQTSTEIAMAAAAEKSAASKIVHAGWMEKKGSGFLEVCVVRVQWSAMKTSSTVWVQAFILLASWVIFRLAHFAHVHRAGSGDILF